MTRRRKNSQSRHEPLVSMAESDWGEGWGAPMRYFVSLGPLQTVDGLHLHIAGGLRWLILGIGAARFHGKEPDIALVRPVLDMLSIIDQAGLMDDWMDSLTIARQLCDDAKKRSTKMTDAASGQSFTPISGASRSPDLELVGLYCIKVGKALAAAGVTRPEIDSQVESLGRFMDSNLPPPQGDARLITYSKEQYDTLVKPRLVPYGHANPN